MKIKKIEAFEVLDSRGNPTIKTLIMLENGLVGHSMVPSGASTGAKEKLELRDGNGKRFAGKGVLTAIKNAKEKIFSALSGTDIENQKEIDQKMIEADGSEDKSNFGANAILGVSLAVCRAGAKNENIPLWQYIQKKYEIEKKEGYQFPVPMMNVINGGLHADSGLDIQEFMLVPSGIKTFFEKIRAGAEIYQNLGKLLKESGYKIAVGDEGGFASNLPSNEEALKFIKRAVEKSSYEMGKDVKTGIDSASSEFFDKEKELYNLKMDNVSLNSHQLSTMFSQWIEKYQMELIEDPMAEADWEGWANFNQVVGNKISLIGDDLLVTDIKILKEAIEKKACNAVLIKVNQIGTLSEAVECAEFAKKNKMKIAISHRSGETTDDFISDLAVALEAEYVKFGAPARGERVSKYNRIIEIEKTQNSDFGKFF